MVVDYNVTLKMDIDEAQPQMGMKLNTETQTVSNKMWAKELEFQSWRENPEKVNGNPRVNRYQSCD